MFQGLVQAGDTICGFSLGSIVCAHNIDRLSKAKRLVLFGINPHTDAIEKQAGRRAFCETVKSVGAVQTLRANPPALFGDNQAVAMDVILSMATQTENHIGSQTELALSRPDALPILSKADIPVLALTGEKDLLTTPAMGRKAVGAAPFGKSIDIPNTGHYALLEDPLACARAYRAVVTHL